MLGFEHVATAPGSKFVCRFRLSEAVAMCAQWMASKPAQNNRRRIRLVVQLDCEPSNWR
jgi:hypothetical protein